MLVVLATAWTACEGPGTSMEPSAQPVPPVATTERGGEISLSGRVTAVYGPHLLVVGSGAERVIVVTSAPVAVSVGRDVDVTGQVKTFRRQQLEADLGVDLGPAANELENASCLLASVIRVR